jgi:hypothetical protein
LAAMRFVAPAVIKPSMAACACSLPDCSVNHKQKSEMFGLCRLRNGLAFRCHARLLESHFSLAAKRQNRDKIVIAHHLHDDLGRVLGQVQARELCLTLLRCLRCLQHS